jgi:cathepsin D
MFRPIIRQFNTRTLRCLIIFYLISTLSQFTNVNSANLVRTFINKNSENIEGNYMTTTIKLKKVVSFDEQKINFSFLAEVQKQLGESYYESFILSSHQEAFEKINFKEREENNYSFMQKNMNRKLLSLNNDFTDSNADPNILNNTANAANANIEKVDINKTKIIPLKNFKNTQYIGNIKIGEPSQEIPVIFDTGSGNLWVTSILCNSPSCKKKKNYNRMKSKKFSKLGLGVEVTFGTGAVSGELNADTFKLGNMIIPSQKFAEILEQKGNVFDSGKFSGILGLGYPGMSAYNVVPVFDTIIADKLLKQNIMAFYYSYNEKSDGEVSFGFVNKSKYEGEIKYYKVTDKYYWTINLDDILYNGKSLNLCPNGCKAIADTGTTLITGPTKDVRKLLTHIPVQNDCQKYDITGKLQFVIGGDLYELSAEEFITKSREGGKTSCSALIMPLDVPRPHGPAWILGGTFLQKYYSVFDRDNDKVGFALAYHKEERKSYD